VRLVQEREARLRGLDAMLAAGQADIDAGRTKSLEDVTANVQRHIAAIAAKKAS
jgi:antitoxin ParD1/3/4